MKKKLIACVLLISTMLCFAETVVVEDEERDSVLKKDANGLVIELGEVFYNSKRLDSWQLPAWGGSGEIGIFTSDEDGLFDWVKLNTFGLCFGRIDSDNLAFKNSGNSFVANGDGNYGNFYVKNLSGPQLNLSIVSFAFLFGSKAGFDWLKVGGNKDFTYKERRIFVEFAVEPYVSVNISRSIKIYASTEGDLPVLRIRFMRNSYYDDYDIRWTCFKNDIPTTYNIGCVFFM